MDTKELMDIIGYQGNYVSMDIVGYWVTLGLLLTLFADKEKINIYPRIKSYF
uniref:Uncharacterized protein n=1 Tax=Arion vulgaris TaxID=1028688 RepID=A0A0B7AY67_9EUPU